MEPIKRGEMGQQIVAEWVKPVTPPNFDPGDLRRAIGEFNVNEKPERLWGGA